MKIMFGTRTLAMLSGMALATAFVAGCTEETPTPETKPTNPPAAVAPAKTGGDMKATMPPATTPAKPEEAKK